MRISPISAQTKSSLRVNNSIQSKPAFEGLMYQTKKSGSMDFYKVDWSSVTYNYYPFKDEKLEQIGSVKQSIPKDIKPDIGGKSWTNYEQHVFNQQERLSFTEDEYIQYLKVKNNKSPEMPFSEYLKINEEIEDLSEKNKNSGPIKVI